MIGAVLLKIMLPSAMDAMNNKDIEKVMSYWHEDGCLIFPGNTVVSGKHEGKQAVTQFFERYMEQFTHIHFTIKKTYLSNIFDFTLNNTIAIEFECEYTNRHGQTFRNKGVSVSEIKWGKTTKVHDFYFNTDILNTAWSQ